MIDRRLFLLGSTALAGTAISACGGTEDTLSAAEQADGRQQALARRPKGTTGANAAAPSNRGRVIVIGGGMGGTTVAKYLRMWGGVDVTLIDRSPTYTSCIMSSLVLTGQRTMASLQFGYDTLRTKYGVKTVFDEVKSIDPVRVSVTLGSGSVLAADRIVLAPGIEFDAVPGLNNPDAMPHAWKAGPQTTLLAKQLAAMRDGGAFVMTIPPAPYRCPPGPYERACLIADWLRVRKPRSKLIVLDANPDFVTEKDNFSQAFLGLHGSVIQYRNAVNIDHVATNASGVGGQIFLAGDSTPVVGDVVNLIARQRAPSLVSTAGLTATDPAGRFAKVNVLDYSSTVPGAQKVHVIGDSSATTQPKAGHVANQEAKVCADALTRLFAGGQPDPAPVTTSACYSTITMKQASWLHALFQYDGATGTMKAVADASGASVGWNGDHFEEMGTWYKALMADTFA